MLDTIRFKFIYAVFFVIFASTISEAKSSPFYVGIGYGSSQYNGDTLNNIELKSGSKLSKSSSMYQILAGYEIVRDFISIEVSYIDLERVQEKFDLNPDLVFFDSPNDTLSLEGKGFTVSPVIKWNLSQVFSLSGLIGLSILDVKQNFSGGFSETSGGLTEAYSRTEVKLFGGIGLEAKIVKNLVLGAKWQRLQISDTDIDTLSADLKFYF
ncbi:MAG: porin family protein [Lentisphaerae bacterium]|nr:porin family protein [Lentisphaerota bacterium]